MKKRRKATPLTKRRKPGKNKQSMKKSIEEMIKNPPSTESILNNLPKPLKKQAMQIHNRTGEPIFSCMTLLMERISGDLNKMCGGTMKMELPDGRTIPTAFEIGEIFTQAPILPPDRSKQVPDFELLLWVADDPITNAARDTQDQTNLPLDLCIFHELLDCVCSKGTQASKAKQLQPFIEEHRLSKEAFLKISRFEPEAIYKAVADEVYNPTCLLYTSPSPRDQRGSRMPSSA